MNYAETMSSYQLFTTTLFFVNNIQLITVALQSAAMPAWSDINIPSQAGFACSISFVLCGSLHYHFSFLFCKATTICCSNNLYHAHMRNHFCRFCVLPFAIPVVLMIQVPYHSAEYSTHRDADYMHEYC